MPFPVASRNRVAQSSGDFVGCLAFARHNRAVILRQLRVTQREDPKQNACIRVREILRLAAEEATKDEQSPGLLVQV